MNHDTRHAWAERFDTEFGEVGYDGFAEEQTTKDIKAFIAEVERAAEQRVWQAAEAIVREKMRELSNTPLNERLDTWAWLITTRNAIATRIDSRKPE